MNLEKTLHWSVIAGLFATLITPLIVVDSLFFPFITGKAFYFRILVEITLALWIILAILNKKYRPVFSWILGSVGIFLLVIFFSNIFGANAYRSFWSNFERMDGFISLLHLGAFFLVLISVFKSRKIWFWFLNSSLIVNLIVLTSGFIQLAGLAEIHQGGARLDATLGNATYLAIYALIHIFIALFLMVRTGKGARVFYAITVLLNLVILYNTQTRGSMLGLIGGLLISAVLYAIFSKPSLGKKVSITVILGVIFLVGGFVSIKNTSFVQENPTLNRFANISITETKTQARYYIWPMALRGFSEKPILGWGQGNFSYIFQKHYVPEMHSHEPWFDSSHNVFLDWLVAGGILGFLAYLSIMIFSFKNIWKIEDLKEKVILLGLLSGYLIHNIFVFDNLVSYILFFSIIGLVHYETTKNKEPLYKKEFSKNKAIPIAIPIVLVLLSLGIYQINLKPLAASTNLIDGLQSQKVDKTVYPPKVVLKTAEERIESFKKALAFNTLADTQIREQMVDNIFSILNNSNLTEEERVEVINFVIQEIEKEIKAEPEDAKFRMVAGTFYLNIGQVEKALAHLQKAVNLTPQKQVVLMQLGAGYYQAGEKEKAFELFKRAYELDKTYLEAAKFYAMYAILENKTEIFDKLVKENGPIVVNNNIFKSLLQRGEYKRAIELAKGFLEERPDNNGVREILTILYILTNQKQEAIETLEEASSIDPSYKQKADYLIEEIKAGRNPVDI